MRASLFAGAAANTIRAVWFFINGDIELAHLLASPASGTRIPVDFIPVKGNGVEKSVNRAQRA